MRLARFAATILESVGSLAAAGAFCRLCAVGGALCTVCVGCAHDAEERHLTDMASEIDHLQVERDEDDRRVLAADVADPHFSSVPPRLPAPSQAVPPVVRLSDDDTPNSDSPDTEDPSPRPTIRVIGSARRGDVQSLTDDSSADGTPRPSALDPAAKREYDAAIALVKGKQYANALEALAGFLVKWPDHPYADHALYWRGECYYARGDYLHAAEQFEGVVTRFPAGSKTPDALLKLGMAQQKLGDPEKAKEYFDQLARTYPQSDAAHRIPPVRVQAATPSGPASEDHR